MFIFAVTLLGSFLGTFFGFILVYLFAIKIGKPLIDKQNKELEKALERKARVDQC